MDEQDFPDDLLISILIRLPLKSLIKFLSVSKFWYSLITHPYFISCHLHHQHQIYDSHLPDYFISIRRKSECRYSLWRYGEQFPNWSDLSLPPLPNSFVVGSCNGLVCLVNLENHSSSIYVCNPSIGIYIEIDSVPIVDFSCERSIFGFGFGFGFDSFTNDYNVVMIVYPVQSTDSQYYFPAYAQIYSINAYSWRKVFLPDFFLDYYLSFGPPTNIAKAIYVKNVIHWISNLTVIGETDEDRNFAASILTFDVGNGNFGKLSLPPELANKHGYCICLAVIDNLLSALDCFIHYDVDKSYCIWQMKDFGVEESWIVLYRIQAMARWWNPYSGNKEEEKVHIVTSWGTLITFNANDRSSSVISCEIAWFDGETPGKVSSYTESLVLLDIGY